MLDYELVHPIACAFCGRTTAPLAKVPIETWPKGLGGHRARVCGECDQVIWQLAGHRPSEPTPGYEIGEVSALE